jgi:hypothetical protein
MSRLGPSIMKIWTCGSSPRYRPVMPERRSKTSMVSVVWVTLGIYFRPARSKWFPLVIGNHGRNLVISLWIGDKAKINGVAAQWHTPPPKNPSAKIRWKNSCLDGILLIGYLPKSQTINAEYYSSLLVQLKYIWSKNATMR